MTVPLLSFAYIAILGLLYSVLALIVVALRGRHNVPFGHGDIDRLQRAIRVHGNFSEWVPLVALLIAALETTGASSTIVHGLFAALVSARVVHPVALFSSLESKTYFFGRIASASATWLAMVIAAVLLLLRVI